MKFLLVTLFAAVASAAFAPLYNVKEKVPGSYIVVLKNEASLSTFVNKLRDSAFFASLGGRIDRVYGSVLNGFSATLGEKALDFVRRMDMVDFVEEDSIMRASAVGSWGIDRVDQRYGQDNVYDPNGDGTGVHVYVIDTGVRETHSQFGGRATQEVAFASTGGNEDCNGHGTHCAGTIGAADYGVAKNAFIHGVKVLGCFGSGSNTGVIDGVNWVGANAIRPAVASMSLGGGVSAALDLAISNLVEAGVTTIVAAGNDNSDACNYSPARANSAITVAATGIFPRIGAEEPDSRATYSNFGSCVNIFAPGTDITSCWYNSDTEIKTISGTSMATPHVAGAAALFLQRNPSATPQQVRDGLLAESTEDCGTKGPMGSPSCLTFVGRA